MKVHLTDFKSHSRFSADIKGHTCISGKNGQGKTSILEGIVFALFGRNYYGKLGTDLFIKEGTPGATVSVEMGNTEIKRTQGKENTVYLNGVPSKVAEIGSLFPTAETSIPIINPLAFIYEMSDVEKRELFMKYLPQMDRETVFIKHFSDRKDLIDRFKTYTIKTVRDQIKNFETVIRANESQIEGLQLEIQTLDSEIKNIRESMPETPGGVLEREKDSQKELEDLENKIANFGDPRARVEGHREELNILSEQVKPVLEKLQVARLSEAIEKLSTGVTKFREKKEESLLKVHELEIELKNLEQFKSGKCPTCGQDVEALPIKVEETTHDLDEEQKTLNELAEKLAGYEKILAQLNRTQEEVLRNKNSIERYESKYQEYDNMKARVVELKKSLKGNSEQDFVTAVEIERKREQVKIIQNSILSKKGTIARLEDSTEKMKNDMPDLQLLERALSNKGVDSYIAKEQAKEIEKLVKPYMDLQITTVLENKTNDNVREVFEVTHKGVSFRSMSFGERIKASVALGLVLRKLIPGFNLHFVLLDEASVLSDNTLNEILAWLTAEKIDLIFTKASESELNLESI